MLLRGAILIFMVFLTQQVLAGDLPAKAEKGESIFLQKCASCHSIGKGKLVGPDLMGVTERRDANWLREFIKNPQKMFDRKDSVAMQLLNEYSIVMPAPDLKNNEIEYVIEYLTYAGGKAGQAPLEEKRRIQEGDKTRGYALFTGAIPMKNGGPPCIACHTIAGVNIPGGNLGPDLTNAGQGYGKDGIVSVLKDVPFPTMVPVYANKPVTEEEGVHIAEFIASVEEGTPPKPFAKSIYLLFAGIIAAVSIVQFAWGGRLRSVRKNLVSNSTKKEEL